MSVDVSRLRELLAKATPGPCIVSQNIDTHERTLDALRSEGMGEVVHRYGWSRTHEDALLDCELRNAAPALLDAADQVAELQRDRERLDFLSECVMEHGGITANRDRDPYVSSPTFGDLPTVTLFTVPSQHVQGVGLRGAIDSARQKEGRSDG